MTLPADLTVMLSQLAAMRAADRDFVLAQLGPGGEHKLLPLLEQFQQTQISDGLGAMIAQCARDDTPAGMTRRGATALRQAASAAEGKLPTVAPNKVGARAGGALSRGRAWLGLSA